jgi:hypothetical protein
MFAGSAKDLITYVQKNHPDVAIKGTKVLSKKGKVFYFLRGKGKGGKTFRFVCGDDHPKPRSVTTSERKRIGKGRDLKKP